MDEVKSIFLSPVVLTWPLLFLVVAFAWYRAGSFQSFFDRVWLLFAGESKAPDPKLREFIEGTREVERFRFVYGFKVKNKRQLQRLLDWLNQEWVDPKLARQARAWIDSSSDPFVKKPAPSYFLTRGSAFLFCAALCFLANELGKPREAALVTKATDVHMWSDGDTVRGMFGDWRLDFASCADASVLISKSGMNEEEVRALCGALSTTHFHEYIKEAVRDQIIFIASALIALFVTMIILALKLGGAAAAQTLYKRFLDTQLSAPAENVT